MKAYRYSTVCSWLLLVFHLCVRMGVQSTEAPSVPFKAVNLGGWLVTEGWITPRLFENIPNNDMLDGRRVQFESAALRTKYLYAKNRRVSIADNSSTSDQELTFKLWRSYGSEDEFKLRAFNKKFIGLRDGGGLSLVKIKHATTFKITRNGEDKVHIKALGNGMFLQAKSENTVTADFSAEPHWGKSSKAVFLMRFVDPHPPQGEYQLTNAYGANATEVLQGHWNTFIVERDFQFIAESGLNSVRIPVGWWTSKDPNTPRPFVSGSLDVLDNAFRWAEKYNLNVILDLHAPHDSQNGNDHSGSRGGDITFRQESIPETVQVIEFFSKRYGKSPKLAAVELMNEPHGDEVNISVLRHYYRDGYDAVRKYSSTAYVIMSNRLGKHQPDELFNLANGRTRVVIDVHYYSKFEKKYEKMTVQENIEYIYQKRSSQLNNITSAPGILSFVGEWVAQLHQNINCEEAKKFAKAQLKVYGKASFGWAYWTFKVLLPSDQPNYSSLEWMINNGCIDQV